jgi:5-methylcytosine-specific restriction endonuclease McrA
MSRKALLPPGWSQEALTLGRRANFACEYCDRDLLASIEAYHAWTVDHIHPTTKGGPDTLENKALACRLCNAVKRHTVLELPENLDRAGRVKRYREEIVEPRRAAKEAQLQAVRAALFHRPAT